MRNNDDIQCIKGDDFAGRYQSVGGPIDFCGCTMGQECPETGYYNTIIIKQQFFYVCIYPHSHKYCKK